METLNLYLAEHEVRAEQAYRTAYYNEYMRVFEASRSENREQLVFWSELAHRAAKIARDKVLAAAEAAQAAQAMLVTEIAATEPLAS